MPYSHILGKSLKFKIWPKLKTEIEPQNHGFTDLMA